MDSMPKDDLAASVKCFSDLVARLDGSDVDKQIFLTIAKRILERHDDVRRCLYTAMPYSRYLQTEHWCGVRDKALRRAGNRCCLCNSPGELHVHHRTYLTIGHEADSDVICLCADCHSIFHRHRTAEGQRCKKLKISPEMLKGPDDEKACVPEGRSRYVKRQKAKRFG